MRFISLIFTIMFFFSCDKEPTTEASTISCTTHPLVCNISDANNEFAFNLLKEIHQDESETNIFISPNSISMALGMASNGAKNNTLEEILNVLALEEFDITEINDAYLDLLTIFPLLDDQVKLNFANSIWNNEGFPVLQSFIETNKEHFLCEVNPVNFKDPNTLDIINNWIENNTEGLIKDALSNISPDAVLILINTIYFKGEWRYKFDKKDSFVGDFTLPDQSIVQADMMHNPEENIPFMENDIMQMVDLPYGDSIYAMSIILPKDENSISDIINASSVDQWNEWTDQLHTSKVNLIMPKFKLKYGIELKPILEVLGMKDAFSPSADFTNITDEGVLISKVIHKSFIEVNEEGTEAAAVTIIEFVNTSVEPIILMEVNRPFIYAIREMNTGNILFIGQLTNPIAN